MGYGIYPTPQFHISHSTSFCGIYSLQCGINLNINSLVLGQAILSVSFVDLALLIDLTTALSPDTNFPLGSLQ